MSGHHLLLLAPLFCRIAAIMMVLPGYGSVRIPTRVKLYISMYITVSILPGVLDNSSEPIRDLLISDVVLICISEFLVGVTFGLSIRIVFSAIETAGVIISHAIGLSSPFGLNNDDFEQNPIVATILNFTALAIVMQSELSARFLIEVHRSTILVPFMRHWDANVAFNTIVDAVRTYFIIAISLAGPFLIFMLTLNFAVGLISRLVQQAPVYFVSLPFFMWSGMFLLTGTIALIVDRGLALFSQYAFLR